jgi:glycosyltransferase involved in cell wall biosynthesis
VVRLRAATVRAGVADRFDIGGPLIGADLDDAYAAADLLVLPSLGETYGMVVAEALARGLPVVVSDVGGVREAVGDPGAGLFVPPGDPVALTQALRRWLTDADARAGLRRAAARRRTELPGWPATAGSVGAALVAAAAPVR